MDKNMAKVKAYLSNSEKRRATLVEPSLYILLRKYNRYQVCIESVPN